MGFVNNTAGYDQKKVRKYGKLYGSIVGKLIIGNSRFDVTYQEIDHMVRTLHAAKDVINRKYKMGMMK